jgi:hypothetical protein
MRLPHPVLQVLQDASRASRASCGNDMNTYADDLAAVVEALDLKNAVHVGPSTEQVIIGGRTCTPSAGKE